MTERHALVVALVPELRERYLELHSAVWAQVQDTLSKANIVNYSIFERGNLLFAYYEYSGTDHAADMALIAADPVTRRWWELTEPCQQAFFDDQPEDERWAETTEVWHLD